MSNEAHQRVKARLQIWRGPRVRAKLATTASSSQQQFVSYIFRLRALQHTGKSQTSTSKQTEVRTTDRNRPNIPCRSACSEYELAPSQTIDVSVFKFCSFKVYDMWISYYLYSDCGLCFAYAL
eukprot:6189973-Pleurochrysis_carterae.AAC.5